MRFRQIETADLGSVADLLARGFPGRARDYWTRGLDRLGVREVPPGAPRFGYMLDKGGQPVGVILQIAQTITHDGAPYVRSNLASWYVDPAYRSHAALLSAVPLRDKSATYLNISPAPNTWPIVEAQGFKRLTRGLIVTVPLLGRRERGLRIERFRADDPRHAMPEARVLADHAAGGCLSLVGHADDGPHPFVLLPYRPRQGRFWSPAMQLVFCRSVPEVVRFAAAIGGVLARLGKPLLLVDAEGPVEGLPGYFWRDRARRYAKGAHRPRLGDLAYTEFTIFGP